MYFTYILQSEKDGRYYIGSTNNLENRLKRHNKGYSRYTKNNGLLKLHIKKNIILYQKRKKENII